MLKVQHRESQENMFFGKTNNGGEELLDFFGLNGLL